MKKNKVLIALLLVLLFIPSYIAIISYISVSKSPVSVDNATNIIIKDIAGKSYSVSADSEIAALFQKINSGATPIDGIPDKLMDADNFVVSFVEGKRSTDSRYYFSLDTDSVYYLDSTGKAFSVKPEDAAEFLETNYAQSLYAGAYLPVLSNGANTILPNNFEWAFASVTGTPLASTLGETTEKYVTYTSDCGLAFSFSRTPDIAEITVKDTNGNVLYNGDFASLSSSFDAKDYSSLAIDLTANWGGTEDNMSGGHANYSFSINITAQPEFALSFSGAGDYAEFIPGDIAFVTAYGITDPTKITFSSEPALMHNGKEISPVFFNEGENCYAFIPTAYDTAPGEYALTFTYNGLGHPASLSIAEKSFGKGSDLEISVARTKASFTDETLAAYDKMVAEVLEESDFTARHFDESAFGEPYNKRVRLSGYGRPRTTSLTREKYDNKGIDFYLSSTEDILATMDGEVIYVGSTAYAGKAIAIDHGYGLISWYHHVGDVKVSKGDTVKKGDVIAGNVADEGFTGGGMLHFRITVYDVPVSAYDLLWSDADGDKQNDTGISFMK